jgi:hypothetical protein
VNSFPVLVNLGCGVALGIICIASIARADVPPIEGHVALGVRASSTSEPNNGFVVDETARVRVAADGLVGFRLGRTVVGLHAGIATPLEFYASPWFDSGEWVASTNSSIYPVDIGLGIELDARAGIWFSAWLGATVSLTRASSPAARISAIDFTGNRDATSWSDHTTRLGYGAELGYDITRT